MSGFWCQPFRIKEKQLLPRLISLHHHSTVVQGEQRRLKHFSPHWEQLQWNAPPSQLGLFCRTWNAESSVMCCFVLWSNGLSIPSHSPFSLFFAGNTIGPSTWLYTGMNLSLKFVGAGRHGYHFIKLMLVSHYHSITLFFFLYSNLPPPPVLGVKRPAKWPIISCYLYR